MKTWCIPKLKLPSLNRSSRIYKYGKRLIVSSLACVSLFAAVSTIAAWSEVIGPVLEKKDAPFLKKAFKMNAKIFGGAESLAKWAFLSPESGTILRVSLNPETGESTATLADVRPFGEFVRAGVSCGPNYSDGAVATPGAKLTVFADQGLNHAYETSNTGANQPQGTKESFIGMAADHPVQTSPMSADEAKAFALRMGSACQEVTRLAHQTYNQGNMSLDQFVAVSSGGEDMFKYVYASPTYKRDRLLAIKVLTNEEAREIVARQINGYVTQGKLVAPTN
ncbi:MAG: hypothetical protein PHD48_10565 [Alphaproteobacteria bacterium]|nr:hypothetical protein [Alphaproteobacteria bacterium]